MRCDVSLRNPFSVSVEDVSDLQSASVTIVSIVRLKALYDNLNGPINLQPSKFLFLPTFPHDHKAYFCKSSLSHSHPY
jgi:hypothetical protein